MEDTAGVVKLGMPYDQRPESKDLYRFLTDYCKHWRGTGLQLGLKTSVLDQVASAHPMQDRECFRATLEKWLQLNVGVTWSNLELAITNAIRMSLGLPPLPTAATNQSKMEVMQSHDNQPRQDDERSQVEINNDIQSVKELHADTITNLKGNYAAIVENLRLIIESRKLNIKSLIVMLCSLDEDNTTIFSTNKAFKEITSTIELFHHIGQYCSIYDYELLSAFVVSTGCEDAKKLLDDFTNTLYSSILSDLDLLSEDGELKDPKEFMFGTHKLVIKYLGKKCTLKTKEMIQNIICERFRLMKGSIIFKGVQEGCIAFVYQISPAVKSYFLQYPLTANDIAMLYEHQIKCFIIDNEELRLPKNTLTTMWSPNATFSLYLSQQLKLLHDNLKKWYRKLKSTRSLIEETIWSLFPTYPCIGYLSVFHDLSQHGSYTSTLKLLSSVQQLFEGTNGHLKHILIEGHTGIGKTTLCKEICYQWAENNLFTPNKLVLLLLLQDPMAQKITSEYELAEYFTTSFDFIELFSEYLISSCGAGVAIVIDSYDQLNEELQDNGFIKDLIEGIRLSKAQIVITSTPFVSYQLHNCVDRRVEIFELVKSVRDKFISEALKNFPEQLKKLQKHFLEYPEVDILSCVPINMAIMVNLDKRYMSLYFSTNSIYYRFCDHAMTLNESFVQEERYNHKMTLLTLQHDARKQLEDFAYVSLIKNKSVFLEEDLFDMCKKYPTCYGFMQSTECYSSAYYNKRILFNFLCQGVQQHLACSYLKRFSNSRDSSGGIATIKIFSDSVCNSTVFAALKNCLATKILNLFYFMPIDWSMQVLNLCISGINYTGNNAKDKILKIIDDLDEDINSYNFHLHKSKRFKLINQKSNIALDNDLSVKFDMDSELDKLIPKREISADSGYGSRVASSEYKPRTTTVIMLQYPSFLSLCLYKIFEAYYITQNIVKDGRVDFTHYYLLPYHITSLGHYLLWRTNEFKVVDELHLGDCSIGDYGLYLLSCYLCIDISRSSIFSERVKLTTINVIDLHKNNLTAASSLIISKIIDRFKPHSLELSYNNLTYAGLVKVCNAVMRNQVHKLNLAENGLTAQGTRSINLMMNVLKVLDISHNNIGNQGGITLSQGLAHTVTLKRFDISHCNIGEAGACELAYALKINSSLEILRMKSNPIGHTGVAVLVVASHINKTLNEFSVSDVQ